MGTMALALGSAGLSIYGRNKALEAQAEANVETSRNIIKSMNFSIQNLNQQRADAFDATIAELQKIKLSGNRLTKQVENAVNEGLMGGGRTADMLKRSARADVNRATDSSKDNYQRKLNEIQLNKESVANNAKMQISSIKQVEEPSWLETLAQIGTAYIGAKQTEESIDAIQSLAGVVGGKESNSVGGLNGDLFKSTFSDHFLTEADYARALGMNKGVSTATQQFDFTYKNPYLSTGAVNPIMALTQSLIKF